MPKNIPCWHTKRWHDAGESKRSGGDSVTQRSGLVKQIVGKDSRFKIFWSGNDNGTGGVGILHAEEWWEWVFEVVRVSDKIILIRMTIGKTVFVFVSVYAPQANLSEAEKDRFYQMLQCTVATIPIPNFRTAHHLW